jgi:TetR/AcrR family transcriptional repressor of nem operon
VDSEVAEEVARTMRDFDTAVDLALSGAAIADGAPAELAYALTATILGLRMRARTGAGTAGAGTVLFDRIHQP